MHSALNVKMIKLIVANWKMNKTVEESCLLANELKNLLKNEKNVDIAVCPAFTSLHPVSKELKGSNIKLGAQNMHFENSGAYTGEVSPSMIKDLGCEFVIIGHSERRESFNEDDSLINKKLAAALRNGLKPILCIGENWEQRLNEETEDILEYQLLKCLSGIESIKDLVIAYEPIWAISKGNPNQKAATKADAEESHLFIRKVISGIYEEETAKNVRIIYGGSLKPENAKELLSMPNINGGLVGNASLNAKSFAEIVKAAK